LRPDTPGAYLFSPYESLCELRARARTGPARKGRRSGRTRRADRPFRVTSYSRAIRDGIARANAARASRGEPPILSWHPHQLRHAVAGRINREFDLDTARVVLGHSSVKTTDRYVKTDYDKAAEAMEKLG
jgi:integrase